VKRMKICLMTGILLAGVAHGVVEPVLPVWKTGEKDDLKASGWVAGGLLLTDEVVPGELKKESEEALDVDQPNAEEIAEAESPTNQIPETYWPEYFGERPKNFLVDPQGLLSPVDYRDRLAFLNYHAGDSSIDLFVYVFKGDQEIPGEVREEELVERFFSEGRPAVIMYCYLGAPQRSVLYLSPSLTDAVSAAEQRRALESSVIQAFGKLDPTAQIEALLVQMSIRIYWMERMQGSDVAASGDVPESRPVVKTKEKASASPQWLVMVLDKARPYLIPAAASAAVLVFGLRVTSWLRRSVHYRFPEFDVEPRLGGSHAAGIGAVISFASAAVPPASQRDQVPDYLRRA
jgi:hypothetical protein